MSDITSYPNITLKVDNSIIATNIINTANSILSNVETAAETTTEQAALVTTKAAAATAAATTATTAANTAINSADAANLAAQNVGTLAFTTFTLMNADLAHAANTICLVTNDVNILGQKSYTVTTNSVAADTLTVGGVTLTATASTTSSTQFAVGLTIADTVTNIVTALNANTTVTAKYTATKSSATFTLTEITAAGNTPADATYTGTIAITNGTGTTSHVKSNGQYIKLGASGTGSWQKSEYTPSVANRSINRFKLAAPFANFFTLSGIEKCITVNWVSRTVKVDATFYIIYGTEGYVTVNPADAQIMPAGPLYNNLSLIYYDRADSLVKLCLHSTTLSTADYDILAIIGQDQIVSSNPDLITIINTSSQTVCTSRRNTTLDLVRDMNAPIDGTTDSSAKIQGMVTSGQEINIPKGIFKASGITTGTSYGVRGSGNGSLIVSNADAPLFTVSGTSDVSFERVRIDGANIATYTSEKGVVIQGGKEFVRITNAMFKKFAGASAVYVANSYANHDTLMASNTFFLNNNIGFHSDVRGEFCILSNCHFNGNTIAAKILGGNVSLNGCEVNNNVDGIQLLSGTNDSHGKICNCDINHNTSYGLLIDGIANGETISSCHIYQSKIWIKNIINHPVRFDNCVIDPAELRIENCYMVIFNNCDFPGGYLTTTDQIIITDSTVKFHNNIAKLDAIKTIIADN